MVNPISVDLIFTLIPQKKSFAGLAPSPKAKRLEKYNEPETPKPKILSDFELLTADVEMI